MGKKSKEEEIWEGIGRPIHFGYFELPKTYKGMDYLEWLNFEEGYYTLGQHLEDKILISERFSKERVERKFPDLPVLSMDKLVPTLVHELEHFDLFNTVTKLGYPEYAKPLGAFNSHQMSKVDTENFHIKVKTTEFSKETIEVDGKKKPVWSRERVYDAIIPVLEIK